MERLIKAAYREIGKPNPFDAAYRPSTEILVASGHPVQTNDDLMRQALISFNQAFPAVLQGLRSLNVEEARLKHLNKGSGGLQERILLRSSVSNATNMVITQTHRSNLSVRWLLREQHCWCHNIFYRGL